MYCLFSLWSTYFLHIKARLVGTGYETTFAGGSGGGGYSSSTYESTSYSTGGVSGDAGSSGFHITEAKL